MVQLQLSVDLQHLDCILSGILRLILVYGLTEDWFNYTDLSLSEHNTSILAILFSRGDDISFVLRYFYIEFLELFL